MISSILSPLLPDHKSNTSALATISLWPGWAVPWTREQSGLKSSGSFYELLSSDNSHSKLLISLEVMVLESYQRFVFSLRIISTSSVIVKCRKDKIKSFPIQPQNHFLFLSFYTGSA